MKLILKKDFPIKESEKAELDSHIDEMIAKHKGNATKVNLWTMEAVSLATSVEARSEELDSQGLLSRAWNSLTGKNQKLSARNQSDLARAQYLSQQVLAKLAEQNCITFEMTVVVGEKLNLLARDHTSTKESLAQLYDVLSQFFGQVRNRIENLEHEFRRNDDLLFWKETILEHKVYRGQLYSQLDTVEKIVCIASEFFQVTTGHWGSRDLAFLKSTMRAVGVDPEVQITPLSIHQHYQTQRDILAKLTFSSGVDDIIAFSTIDTPMLHAFTKLDGYQYNERYLVDTVAEFATDISRREIEISLLNKFIYQHSGRDLSKPTSTYDLVMDLVGDLLLSKTYSQQAFLEQPELLEQHEAELVEIQQDETIEEVIDSQVLLTLNPLDFCSSKSFFKYMCEFNERVIKIHVEEGIEITEEHPIFTSINEEDNTEETYFCPYPGMIKSLYFEEGSTLEQGGGLYSYLSRQKIQPTPVLSLDIRETIARDIDEINIESPKTGILKAENFNLNKVIRAGSVICKIKSKLSEHEVKAPSHGVLLKVLKAENEAISEGELIARFQPLNIQ